MNNEYSTLYGLVCIGLLIIWVWNLVLGIQVMKRLKEHLKWLEKFKDKIEEFYKK